MSKLDWDGDPELRALRDEFVDSLAGRRERLARGRSEQVTATADASRCGIRDECHRLAGAAESYGFVFLSRLAGAVEDLIELGNPDPRDLESFVSLLDTALGRALANRRDPSELEADPRWLTLVARVTPLLIAAGQV